MRKLKVLLLFDVPYAKPRGYDYAEEFREADWDAERNARDALVENGHEVRLLGLYNDIRILFDEIGEDSVRGDPHLEARLLQPYPQGDIRLRVPARADGDDHEFGHSSWLAVRISSISRKICNCTGSTK